MIDFSRYKAILWDFDGVILDSMPIRDRGFELVLADYPKPEVDALMAYHRANGGLSRYVKFRYFFENIRNESITDEAINELANRFSVIMRRELNQASLIIRDSVDFISIRHRQIPMYVVSGSDERELRYLCQELGLARYFGAILGSPRAKPVLINEILTTHGYSAADIILIGDSHNDAAAAASTCIDFAGYNNEALRIDGRKYIERFTL